LAKLLVEGSSAQENHTNVTYTRRTT